MDSPGLSENETENDEVDDVTTGNYTGSCDVPTSGALDRLRLEGDSGLAKMSDDFSRGSSSGGTKGSAEQSSESVDRVSGMADRGEEEEDMSEYQTDFTISESLEEHDRHALALERSSGLARSTGEVLANTRTVGVLEEPTWAGSSMELEPTAAVSEEYSWARTWKLEPTAELLKQFTSSGPSRELTPPVEVLEDFTWTGPPTKLTPPLEVLKEHIRAGSCNKLEPTANNLDKLSRAGPSKKLASPLREEPRRALGVLTRSTGETFEYFDSDEPSESISPVNEELEMTMALRDDDIGSPVAQSTMIGDDTSTDEPRCLDSVLSQERNVQVTNAEEQGHHEDSSNLRETLEMEEQELEEEDQMLSADDSKGAEDYHRPQQDNLEMVVEQNQSGGKANETGYTARLHFSRNYSMDNANGAEDTLLPGDDLDITAEDQPYSPTEDIDAGLEVEQPEIEKKHVDDGNLLGETVTLDGGLEDSVASSDDQLKETLSVAESQLELNECGSPENADDDDSVAAQRETCSDKELEEEGCRDPSSTDRKTEQHQRGSDSVLGHSAGLDESQENKILLSSDLQRPKIPENSDRAEDASYEKDLEEKRSPDDDQHSALDVVDFASTSDAARSIATTEDLQDTARCGADDLTSENKYSSQQALEHQDFTSDLPVAASTDKQTDLSEDRQVQSNAVSFQQALKPQGFTSDLPVAAAIDEQKDICFARDLSEERQDQGSAIYPDLTVAVTTPSCMQLEVLSRSPLEHGSENHMQVVQCNPGPGTWSEDEDKSNLLCLLDSQRRTELDQNNWQLARRIEDKMTLVKDAELDDLENVQVSVKVSP